MKKLICEVDEDYLNELCEAFKKYPMGGIPTHRAWALLEGLKNGIVLDGLTNREVAKAVFGLKSKDLSLKFRTQSWWNAKWGE